VKRGFMKIASASDNMPVGLVHSQKVSKYTNENVIAFQIIDKSILGNNYEAWGPYYSYYSSNYI